MNIIFDIDGTLVQSYGFDTECFVGAVRDVLGDVEIHPDWAHYTDVTDEGILRQIAEDNAVSLVSSEPVRQRFSDRVRVYLTANPDACQPMPGAVAMLADLMSRDGLQVGLATGGWSVTARVKLAHAGLAEPEGRLFSSDVSARRVDIMQACHAAIATPAAPTIYVGDGEWDMAAAAELGWALIGIGPRLRGKCEHWVADFTGTAFSGHLNALGGFR